MKKFNVLVTLLASAVIALCAVSCATPNEDLEPSFDISSLLLRGNMNGWGDSSKLTANGDGTYSVTYTAKDSTDEFKIADSSWTTAYAGGASVAVDGTTSSLAMNGGNAKVTGQTANSKYTMTLTPVFSPSGNTITVSVKAVE